MIVNLYSITSFNLLHISVNFTTPLNADTRKVGLKIKINAYTVPF
jgi:hypothetical protein